MDLVASLISLALSVFVLIALGQLFAIKKILDGIRTDIHLLVKQNAGAEVLSEEAQASGTICAAPGCGRPRLGPNTPFCLEHHVPSA